MSTENKHSRGISDEEYTKRLAEIDRRIDLVRRGFVSRVVVNDDGKGHVTVTIIHPDDPDYGP